MRRQNDQMAPGSMGFSSIHRRTAELSLNEVGKAMQLHPVMQKLMYLLVMGVRVQVISITAHSLEHDKRIYLSMVEFEVSFLSRTRR